MPSALTEDMSTLGGEKRAGNDNIFAYPDQDGVSGGRYNYPSSEVRIELHSASICGESDGVFLSYLCEVRVVSK